MQKMILSSRKILHAWDSFRTDDAKEDYCCRGKPGGGEVKNTFKAKIKENNVLDNEMNLMTELIKLET